jgi:galactokinase
MVEVAWQAPGVIGARMTGGGFGGCAVALVEQAQAQAFSEQVAREYQGAVDLVPNLYVCAAQAGARAVY